MGVEPMFRHIMPLVNPSTHKMDSRTLDALVAELRSATDLKPENIEQLWRLLREAERRSIGGQLQAEKDVAERKNQRLELELGQQKTLICELESTARRFEDEIRVLEENIHVLEVEKKALQIAIEESRHPTVVQNDDGSARPLILGISNLQKRNDEAIHDALSAFDKKCPYCGKDHYRVGIRDKIERDHFIPIARGGQDVPWNLLPICKECNRKKKDSLPIDFLSTAIYQRCVTYLLSVRRRYEEEAITQFESMTALKGLIEDHRLFLLSNAESPFVKAITSLMAPQLSLDIKSLQGEYLEEELSHEFRVSKSRNVRSQKILEVIRKSGYKGATTTNLAKSCQGIAAHERGKIIEGLLKAGVIEEHLIKQTGLGRPRRVYKAK